MYINIKNPNIISDVLSGYIQVHAHENDTEIDYELNILDNDGKIEHIITNSCPKDSFFNDLKTITEAMTIEDMDF